MPHHSRLRPVLCRPRSDSHPALLAAACTAFPDPATLPCRAVFTARTGAATPAPRAPGALTLFAESGAPVRIAVHIPEAENAREDCATRRAQRDLAGAEAPIPEAWRPGLVAYLRALQTLFARSAMYSSDSEILLSALWRQHPDWGRSAPGQRHFHLTGRFVFFSLETPAGPTVARAAPGGPGQAGGRPDAPSRDRSCQTLPVFYIRSGPMSAHAGLQACRDFDSRAAELAGLVPDPRPLRPAIWPASTDAA